MVVKPAKPPEAAAATPRCTAGGEMVSCGDTSSPLSFLVARGTIRVREYEEKDTPTTRTMTHSVGKQIPNPQQAQPNYPIVTAWYVAWHTTHHHLGTRRLVAIWLFLLSAPPGACSLGNNISATQRKL